MPFIPAVLRDDVWITTIFFHCQGCAKRQSDAGGSVSDFTHLNLGKRLALLSSAACSTAARAGTKTRHNGSVVISFFPESIRNCMVGQFRTSTLPRSANVKVSVARCYVVAGRLIVAWRQTFNDDPETLRITHSIQYQNGAGHGLWISNFAVTASVIIRL